MNKFVYLLVVIFIFNIFYIFNKIKHRNDTYYNVDNIIIAMPNYYKRVTGYDSIQLIMGGRAKYNESKHDYDVTWDSLYANFCYPNKFKK